MFREVVEEVKNGEEEVKLDITKRLCKGLTTTRVPSPPLGWGGFKFEN